MRLSFGDHTLDTQHFQLRHGAELIAVEPKVFDVLSYLVTHRDRVVTKEELLDAIWPGEHVVDAVVVRCVYMARRALGQTDVNGPPVATVRGRGYRFLAAVTVARDSSGMESLMATPFVGRESVMKRLAEALSSVERGTGRVALLAGAAGIGKTRAADELVSLARQRGIEVWTARCHAAEGVPAFWTLMQLVRTSFRSFDDDTVTPQLRAAFDHLVKLLPELLRDAPPSESRASTEHDHFRLFDAVSRMLRIACAQKPRIVFVDDLQWADLPTLRLLGFLAADIGDYALLVLGTLREGELTTADPRKLSLDRWGRFRQVERIVLDPLQASDVEQYVAARLGKERPELARVLHQHSEGNPFFMVELLRPYLSQPTMMPPTATPRLPDASRDIVRERLAKLPIETQRVLWAASVLGRTFDAHHITLITGDDGAEQPTRTLGALARAQQHQLLTRDSDHPGRWTFAHGLVREAIYDDLDSTTRVQLHSRVAHALQAQVPEPLAEIAYHLRCALPHSSARAAYEYALRAGDQARRQHAHDSASEHYAHALFALNAAAIVSTAAERFDVLMSLAESQRRSGHAGQAAERYEQAIGIARDERRTDLLAQAVLGLRDCQPLRTAPDPRIQGLLFEAFSVLPDKEINLRARLASRLAAVRSVTTRQEMSARAAELAQHVHDDTTLADVLSARLHAAQGPGEVQQRLALADQLEQLAARRAEPHWAREARIARYDTKLRLGDIHGAGEALDACEQLAQSYHHPVMQMEVVRFRAQRALFAGQFDDALAGTLRALELADRVESSLAEFHFGVQMIWLLRDRGLLPSVDQGIEKYMARYRWVEGNALAAVGHLYAEKGDLVQARSCLDFYAHEAFDNVVYGEDWVAVCAHLSAISHRLNEPAHAEKLHAMLAPYADQNVVNGALIAFGSAQHFVGLLCRLMNRTDEAVNRFEAALLMNERLGALPALVRTQLALADVLDDSPRAAALRSSAHSTATRIGLHLPER